MSASEKPVQTQPASRSQPATSQISSASISGGGAAALQLKASLRGHDYATQVQMLAPEGGKRGRMPSVHEAAAHGISGAAGKLPDADKIQQSFGGYDISNVQAHTSGAAHEASRAMGADAYATGNHVVLGAGGADLHTQAHEAAHVVQQKQGVSLSGGVGKAGDVYEKHADQVADLVVEGESAEGLLGQVAAGGGGGASVQKQEAEPGTLKPMGRGDGARMRSERKQKQSGDAAVLAPRVLSHMGTTDAAERGIRDGDRAVMALVLVTVMYALLSAKVTSKNLLGKRIGMTVGGSLPPPAWDARVAGALKGIAEPQEWQTIATRICVGFREWNHWLALYDGEGQGGSFRVAYDNPTPENLRTASLHLAYVAYLQGLLHADLLNLVSKIRE